MLEWARGVTAREPDVRIGEHELGGTYLERWWAVPRNYHANVYVHRFLRSDRDVMHDHPWDNMTVVLEGEYLEETPHGTFHRRTGEVVFRQATDAHRVVLPEGQTPLTAFFTGPSIRDWGFHCPKGWMGWKEFTRGGDKYNAPKGCGEED